MKIEIDSRSGFCFGVVKAISKAESELSQSDTLFCLGEIVHNSEEVERLKELGLITVTHADLKDLGGKKVMLRAHGEPPQTYTEAAKQGIELVDATCPVVLKLQIKIRKGWERMQQMGGQVVIFGKKGHAEVVGLLGQTMGNTLIIESINEIDKLNFSKPIEIFAQTTKSVEEYSKLVDAIKHRMEEESKGKPFHFKVHNSICGQVSNRKNEIISFAANHNLILFVSGKSSSNGKMLFEVCQSVNPKSYFISNAKELKPSWFKGVESVGICGATSTPKWLMEEVAKAVEQISA
jgi:4-hydroxy-3-methylbut-2-enyl diphosphate reductase